MTPFLWGTIAYLGVALGVFLVFLVDALRPNVGYNKFSRKDTIVIGFWVGVFWFPLGLLTLWNTLVGK